MIYLINNHTRIIMNDNLIVESYLNSSIEDIEMSIGRIVLASKTTGENGMHTAWISVTDAKEACDEFIEDISERLQKRICFDVELSSKKSQETLNDNIQIALAIAALIKEISGVVPHLMLASLLVKRGIEKLCGEK
jgi:hypothetical protein